MCKQDKAFLVHGKTQILVLEEVRMTEVKRSPFILNDLFTKFKKIACLAEGRG